MIFEESTIWLEVKRILGSDERKLYEYKGTMHTVKEDYPVWEIMSIETVRDYASQVGESTKIVFRIGLGDYVYRFYPYRENLEFTLKRSPIKEAKDHNDDEILVVRYKAIFDRSNNPEIATSELENVDHRSLNIMNMVEVHLDLVHRSLEPLRIKTTSGCYQEKTPENMLRGIIGSEASKILVDGKPCLDGLDIVEIDNKEKQHTTIIEHGTRLLSLPTYFQESLFGLYNRGIGSFFQVYDKKKILFIYPLYDKERFDQVGKKMIFYGVPQEKLPQLDRSWRREGDIVKVAVTAQRKYTDSAEASFMNIGSGFRMAEARSFLRKPVEMTPEGPIAKRVRLNHEAATVDREDNLNYLPMTKGGPSQNPFKMRSLINMVESAQLDFVWENADPELIYPGMPCKYFYMVDDQVRETVGTILFVHSFTTRIERYRANAFRNTCRVSVACAPLMKKPSIPIEKPIGD